MAPSSTCSIVRRESSRFSVRPEPRRSTGSTRSRSPRPESGRPYSNRRRTRCSDSVPSPVGYTPSARLRPSIIGPPDVVSRRGGSYRSRLLVHPSSTVRVSIVTSPIAIEHYAPQPVNRNTVPVRYLPVRGSRGAFTGRQRGSRVTGNPLGVVVDSSHEESRAFVATSRRQRSRRKPEPGPFDRLPGRP